MQKQEEKLYKRPQGRKRQKHHRDRQSTCSWYHLYSRHEGEFDLPIHHFQEESSIYQSTTSRRQLLKFLARYARCAIRCSKHCDRSST
jgi:hypothetical protein